MDWIPVVFVTFKLLVFGTGMFFAIKWHYDQGRKKRGNENQSKGIVMASGKGLVLFALGLVVVALFAVYLVRTLGLNLDFNGV